MTALAMLATATAAQELALSSCWAEGMVVQRERPLPVVGTAPAGAAVAVAFAGHEAETTADGAGRWRVELPALPAGGPHELVVSVGDATRRIGDVLVGDRWICAGQSNMGVSVSRTAEGAGILKRPEVDALRLCRFRSRPAAEPVAALRDDQRIWRHADGDSVPGFSAVGYAFGRALRSQGVEVPIGLVQTHKPGSFIESWIPGDALAADPVGAPILARWDELAADREALQAQYEQAHAAWQAAHGERFTAWKRMPVGGPFQPHEPSPPPSIDSGLGPSRFWNGNVAPLTELPITGVVWYQGESNGDRAYQYRDLIRLLVRSWRAAWGQDDLPVIVIQLPEFEADGNPYDHQDGGDWTVMRESQAAVLAEPHTALALGLGYGEPGDIHPRRKAELGRRAALAALRIAYGRDDVPRHPLLAGGEADGERFVVRFDHVGDGLQTLDGGPPVGFVVAGEDGVFHPAQAELIGSDAVALRSDAVAAPVAARYAWDDVPAWNLVGAGFLPAAPGRTDAWPLPTQDVTAPLDWHRLEAAE